MNRFERIDPALASDPVAGLRLYGRRETDGRAVVIVVHEVDRGRVYFAKRTRGERTGYWHSWRLRKIDLADWPGEARKATAARLPRIQPGEAMG